jgi:hypothetical protein
VDVLVAHGADAQRVDQRVAEVGLVEHDLAADVGQPQAVAVAADAGDDARQDPAGVGGVERAEAQGVHHRERTRAHRQDVAHDAADAGGRTLVGLDERRVVVALDLERHGPAVADVDDAGVLADADEQGVGRGAFSPNWRRCTLLDLYEQCSLHITEYIASSELVGRRPRISRMRWYSSGLRPSSAKGCGCSGLCSAWVTVSVMTTPPGS